MRPGEVTIMRTRDIDQTDNPWLYQPSRHKNQHHLHERLIYLGPKTQEIVRRFLKPFDPNAYIFSPIDAMREFHARRNELRKTPRSCGNGPGTNRRSNPKRQPLDHYRVTAYGHAITKACEKAFPPLLEFNEDEKRQWKKDHHWHPHQLRHNAATQLRKEYGLDVAQIILGHKCSVSILRLSCDHPR
jgi:integrase